MKDITEQIIENEGLIYKIINKYRNYFEIEDLYQVAVMGLIKASKTYNSDYGAKFTSYAYPFILGEVIKYINEYRNIKISKENAKLYSKILKAIEILSQKLMKIPSNYELSLFLEIDEALINDIMIYQEKVKSLDEVIMDDGKQVTLLDQISSNNIEEEYTSLHDSLAALNKDELEVL